MQSTEENITEKSLFVAHRPRTKVSQPFHSNCLFFVVCYSMFVELYMWESRLI